MKNLGLTIAVVSLTMLLAANTADAQLVASAFGGDMPNFNMMRVPPTLGDYYLLIAKTILSSVNTVLLILVLIIYIEIYYRTASKFSLGLVLFAVALLLYSLTSNPIIHGFAGFMISGLGPFTILPDLFTCVASAILLYLSQQ